jgi:uncharacterized protein with von Willebrand factor type A (vWA) domain
MLVRFFTDLRAGGVPVTLPEFLGLLEGLDARLAAQSPEDFYYLARMALVKDERHFDRFDRVFAEHFAGAEKFFEKLTAGLPAEWLKALTDRLFTEEEKKRLDAEMKELGGWEKLMETLRQRLREQQGRHEGGSKWIGTAGTSAFGNQGYNPRGVRIGQGASRHGRALKVWEARDYRNLDDGVELGTRNIKMALRRLRRFAREGAAEELDLDGTIDSTARNAGILDLRLQPERRNAIKLLLLLDVGGSMDPHVKICEEVFSAVRAEFRHLGYFYFHNFPYERLWKDNRRRFSEITDTWKLLRTFNSDYRVVFVGDATMSPYEIEQPGGSVEHWNDEAGHVWMQRIASHFPRLVWLNPEPEDHWQWTPSVGITRQLLGDRMYPLTLDGIDRAMRELKRRTLYTAPHVS